MAPTYRLHSDTYPRTSAGFLYITLFILMFLVYPEVLAAYPYDF